MQKVQRYKEEGIKVKVESVMQPGFPVAAATAYRVAGFCSPGCHGCTGEVVSSNLLSLLLIAVIGCRYVIVCRAASSGIKAKMDDFESVAQVGKKIGADGLRIKEN